MKNACFIKIEIIITTFISNNLFLLVAKRSLESFKQIERDSGIFVIINVQLSIVGNRRV